MRFEMDESEESDDPRNNDPFGDAVDAVRYNYADIMKYGSPEIKRAALIILGGEPPAIYKKGESA